MAGWVPCSLARPAGGANGIPCGSLFLLSVMAYALDPFLPTFGVRGHDVMLSHRNREYMLAYDVMRDYASIHVCSQVCVSYCVLCTLSHVGASLVYCLLS